MRSVFSINDHAEHVHDISALLRPSETLLKKSLNQRVLIILNTSFSANLLRRLWVNAGHRICADGGANRLFDTLGAEARRAFVPDYIIGDLDSVRDEVADL